MHQCTYENESMVLDTEMIEENHFSFSAIIQQFSFADAQQFSLNANLCPIYSPINNFY